MNPYMAVLDQELSQSTDRRYVIIDPITNEILDDSQGFGYKSIQKAYEGFEYRCQSKTERDRQIQIRNRISQLLLERNGLSLQLEQLCFEKMPAKVLIQAEDITGILEELRINLKDYSIELSDLIRYL
ncbi:hypothetical protein [Ileibacterium valens]|uniref:hypothetical protein n=1 Tax=Ileibacterium valens TaxID=1862668 RepID=UPI00272B6357|nr:hypothetical protein [Ileibacterium valens]